MRMRGPLRTFDKIARTIPLAHRRQRFLLIFIFIPPTLCPSNLTGLCQGGLRDVVSEIFSIRYAFRAVSLLNADLVLSSTKDDQSRS